RGPPAGGPGDARQRGRAAAQSGARMVLRPGGAGLRPRGQPTHRRVGLGAPAEAQADQGGDHPPANRDRDQARLGLLVGGEHGDSAQHRGRAGAEQDRALEEVHEAHVRRAYISASSSLRTPSVPSTSRSASRASSGGASSERTATHRPLVSSPDSTSRRSWRNTSRSVRSSPTYIAALISDPRSSAGIRRPLSMRIGGRTSRTLRPQWTTKPSSCARAAISSTAAAAASSSGAPRQWNAAIASLSSLRTRRRWYSLV